MIWPSSYTISSIASQELSALYHQASTCFCCPIPHLPPPFYPTADILEMAASIWSLS